MSGPRLIVAADLTDEELKEHTRALQVEALARESRRKMKNKEQNQKMIDGFKVWLDKTSINILAPKHTSSMCTDENTRNGFEPYNHSETWFEARCSRCALLDFLNSYVDVPEDRIIFFGFTIGLKPIPTDESP